MHGIVERAYIASYCIVICVDLATQCVDIAKWTIEIVDTR